MIMMKFKAVKALFASFCGCTCNINTATSRALSNGVLITRSEIGSSVGKAPNLKTGDEYHKLGSIMASLQLELLRRLHGATITKLHIGDANNNDIVQCDGDYHYSILHLHTISSFCSSLHAYILLLKSTISCHAATSYANDGPPLTLILPAGTIPNSKIQQHTNSTNTTKTTTNTSSTTNISTIFSSHDLHLIDNIASLRHPLKELRNYTLQLHLTCRALEKPYTGVAQLLRAQSALSSCKSFLTGMLRHHRHHFSSKLQKSRSSLRRMSEKLSSDFCNSLNPKNSTSCNSQIMTNYSAVQLFAVLITRVLIDEISLNPNPEFSGNIISCLWSNFNPNLLQKLTRFSRHLNYKDEKKHQAAHLYTKENALLHELRRSETVVQLLSDKVDKLVLNNRGKPLLLIRQAEFKGCSLRQSVESLRQSSVRLGRLLDSLESNIDALTKVVFSSRMLLLDTIFA